MTTAAIDSPAARPSSPRASKPSSEPWLSAAAIRATFRRQLGSLLLNPLGYVYILVFVLASAAVLFWPDSFYARNIADVGPLTTYMPWLLAVLLPSLAMGTWASERELGTEEQLLTLPMRPIDALVGKWLGVVAFFTLALLFTFSNVIVLAWLGKPDFGAIVAGYVGWWVAGLVFTALGILASTLVSLPAVAFVIGASFCAIALGLFWSIDWFDPFNRGLIAFGRIISALSLCAAALGAAATLLWARRWQWSQRKKVSATLIVFVCLCITGWNVGLLLDRGAVDLDVTAERLSTLGAPSKSVLQSLNEPVKVVAFISRDLPPELQPKGKEVESTLKTIERSTGGRLQVELHRPNDPLDADGSLATQYYGLTPRKIAVNAVTGRQEQEVFLSAVVTGGPRTQRIDYFDPGLSVEYELVRAVRAVGAEKKKVVGIAATDLKMMGGFDFQTRSSAPRWQIVSEWEKQYDVREVNLDAPVASDINVLVAPQPSRLSDAQIRNLHDHIWAGGPTLMLEDPFPIFAGPQLATSQPKTPANPMMGMPPEQNGNLQPLLQSLGIDLPPDQIVWSDFNPSHAFRRILSPAFVWAYRDQKSIGDQPLMKGISSLLVPFPGMIRVLPDRASDLSVNWLIRPTPNADWGWNYYREHVQEDPFFGMRKVEPTRLLPAGGDPAPLAVEISGTMRRAFPLPPATQPTTGPTSQPATAPSGVGNPSPKPIHVVFVADTDLAHDQFFEFYRNADNRFGQEELKFLQDLRNVQFMGNAVDSLAGEQAFMELRTRRRQRRPLDRLEQVLAQTQKSLRDVEASAQQDAEKKIQNLRDELRQRLDKIRARQDLDENGKRQLVAQVERSANRQLESDISEINRQSDLKVRQAQIEQQRSFERVLNYGVRTRAMGIPAIVLVGLALAVFAARLRGEQLSVPESRRRTDR